MNMLRDVKVNDEKVNLNWRFSTVCQKINETWYFIHLHYSLPADN